MQTTSLQIMPEKTIGSILEPFAAFQKGFHGRTVLDHNNLWSSLSLDVSGM